MTPIVDRHLEEHCRVPTRLSVSNDYSKGDDSLKRRSFLLSCATLCATLSSSASTAVAAADVRAPFIELLLPATRVKLYIDQAVELCKSLKANESASEASSLIPLKDLLENEPAFMTEKEQKLSKRYLEIKTTAAWQDARRKEREARGAEMGIDYTTPYDQVNTAIQQWGDNTQFRILRSRQRKLEKSSTIRTALNAYTNNLVFGDAYQLNVQGEEKKALVRNDALPNVNAVVVSDLDLRDLYRNQVLQNMDDARAEIEYQLKSSDFNVDEVLTCLRQAQSSCQDWFNLIPKGDVEEALKLVMEER
ncbi:unnamed protein product [Cylindrotheca closterium]|uniref:Uncharacterized protein n=1 Tax=Cylindrotheca closterium TaxID=2856 RepID=A0AAD2G4Z9_9STRA|nr:unnamed protein product [Cylindrotheca closterium]